MFNSLGENGGAKWTTIELIATAITLTHSKCSSFPQVLTNAGHYFTNKHKLIRNLSRERLFVDHLNFFFISFNTGLIRIDEIVSADKVDLNR
jgi:hypothetical protein